MRHDRAGPHTKSDGKAHLVWAPKYRKPVLVGAVTLRVRALLRQMAMKQKLEILEGKVARDHVHRLIAYRPHQRIHTIAQ